MEAKEKKENVNTLFSPIQLGPYTLNNRIIMAPLTRCRAKNNVPTALNKLYYQQRASAGFIITEGAQISAQGAGYQNTPGIYNHEHVVAWQKITQAVHDEGGRIFLQLWHVGRVCHSGVQALGEEPVAPSAIKLEGDYEQARALEVFDIIDIIQDYKDAAENAMAAGFDGVEVHAANGYLIDQFLRDGTNKRDDKYGGDINNRCRFLFEVLEAVIKVWGSDRVGIRLSPTQTFNGMFDSNPEQLFNHVIKQLNPLGLAYLHVVEESREHPVKEGSFKASSLRSQYVGTYMANNEYNKKSANYAIEIGDADMVSFGHLFISNPDLPQRFLLNKELNKTDLNSLYGGDETGYTDYPTL